MKLRSRALFVVLIALACVGCDQTTKLAARTLLPATEITSLLGDTIRLQLAANSGAFLGLGDGMSAGWRQALLSAGVGCMLLAVFWYVLAARALKPAWVLALALMLGGGSSNLLDRLRYGGYVVDFINLGVGPVRTGIFNVADMAIMLAAALLLYASLHERNAKGPA
jgi:signal peptidase II